MADDNTWRPNRSNEPYRRAPEPARASEHAGGTDPLAELARLIGQTDPFAESNRNASRAAQRPADPTPPAASDWQHAPEPPRYPSRDIYGAGGNYADPPARHDPYADSQYADRQYADNRHADQQYADSRYADQQHADSRYADQQYADSRYADQQHADSRYADQQHADSRYADQQHADSRYADQQHADSRYADRQYADDQFVDGKHADRQYADSRYSDVRDEAPVRSPRYDPPAYDGAGQGHEQDYARVPYREDEASIDPHEDAMYDDAPSARRRGGLVMVLALIGCAMVGTAGAYGYRSYYADAGSKDPAPVISADTNTPNKIVPAGANSQANKSISERFANAASGGEQLVSRQEEPVALKEPGTPAAPRVVLPSPVAPAANVAPAQAAPAPQAAPPQPPAAAAAAVAPAANNSGGPKRVRTVTIRPDGSDASGRPVNASPAQGAGAAAPRATPPAPRAAAPARNHNGPISLEPQGQPNETGTAPAQPRARVAANPPAARAAPEPEESSAGGGFLVQISSQTNERDARASFQSLQSKFPNELGGRKPVIRRADLGSKGVFYRTNVGPFASHQEASQFCSSYRAAGGQCVVPRN